MNDARLDELDALTGSINERHHVQPDPKPPAVHAWWTLTTELGITACGQKCAPPTAGQDPPFRASFDRSATTCEECAKTLKAAGVPAGGG